MAPKHHHSPEGLELTEKSKFWTNGKTAIAILLFAVSATASVTSWCINTTNSINRLAEGLDRLEKKVDTRLTAGK